MDEDAIIESPKQATTSTHFVWNPFPKIVLSKLPTAVNKNTNTKEPKKPAAIVAAGLDSKALLKICIELKVRSASTEETTMEADSFKGMLAKRRGKN